MTHDRPFEAPDLIEVMEEAVNYNRFLKDLLAEWAGPLGTVLDFGAGNGRFALHLQSLGARVAALEPDPGLRARIARAGIAVYEDLGAVEGESMDGVYSINVLEHIEDDLSVLRSMWRVLRPGGRLLLYVPAFQILYSANDRRVGHVRRYRRHELVDRLADASFRVVRAEYVDTVGFAAGLWYRLFGSRDGWLAPSAVRLYDRVAFPVSRYLDSLLQGAIGKNLLVLGERSETSG